MSLLEAEPFIGVGVEPRPSCESPRCFEQPRPTATHTAAMKCGCTLQICYGCVLLHRKVMGKRKMQKRQVRSCSICQRSFFDVSLADMIEIRPL